MALSLLWLSIVPAAAADCAADAPSPPGGRFAAVTTFFDNEVATGKLPGAVVLVEQRGKPTYLQCFGVRDVTRRAPMTPDTIFALRSMTKPITSVAAMMLIDEGELSLADPVSKYIPAFASVQVGIEAVAADGRPVLKRVAPIRPVTIEDLMRQTSGITYEYIGGELIQQAYRDADIFAGAFDNAEFAERIARLPLARQPGTLWRYGHSTDVLGRVIEIVSGQTLYQFEKQRIFDPLGMTSTKYVPDNDDERARMAEPLPDDTVLVDSERQRRAHPEWQSGGGGLISTITDYARFARMILGGGELDGRRYLSPAAFKAMTTDHIGPGSGVERDYFYFPGDGFGYGYGFAVRTEPGEAKPPPPGSIGELKWDGGSGTYFGVDPKLGVITILMQQTERERGRDVPAFKKLVYDALAASD
ncbi:serine hydrolase domain-containing protein [Rhodopseudomonas sp. NSM]|uniref:serine hydrolase domain-containing protein n=1 Tax=Rhodopseudomonas sp. NSM TaxID=3457630 RepID=UPI004036C965